MAGLLFSFALVVAACGSSDSEATTTTGETEPVTTQASASDVPGLVEDGKLLVVTTGNFPPYTMINEDSGDNEGYSIDL